MDGNCFEMTDALSAVTVEKLRELGAAAQRAALDCIAPGAVLGRSRGPVKGKCGVQDRIQVKEGRRLEAEARSSHISCSIPPSM